MSFTLVNDQTFNNVKILGALITQGSVSSTGNVTFFSNPGSNLTVDLIRQPSNATSAQLRFRTTVGSPAAPVSDWLIGTVAGSYVFNILQQTNATAATAGMNITLNNAVLTVNALESVFTRSTVAAPTVTISRPNDTVASNLNFSTGGNPDTILRVLAGGGRTFQLVTNGGDFNVNLDVGQMILSAGDATTPSMVTTSGIESPSDTGGYRFTGTLFATGATGVVSLNTWVGMVQTTGVADIAAGATGNAVFNNSLVTGTTVGMVTLQATGAAPTSTPRIENVTFGAGTVTVAIRNSGAAATTATSYTFMFTIFRRI